MPLHRQKTLAVLISKHANTKISSLPTDMQTLFGFIKLIADIKYRNQYGSLLPDRGATTRMEEQK